MIIALRNGKLKIRILIVDDDKDMSKLIADILKEAGYQEDRATDFDSAMRKLKKQSYGLVILDYKLPHISGLTLLEEIKKINPSLPVIMISAYGNDYVKAKAKELGAFCFLDKPFAIKELLQSIKERLADEKK